MALIQAERISISKKIIGIPKENANADKIKAQLEVEKVKAQAEDDGNKKIMDEITAIINLYQGEYAYIDGNSRLELVEQDMLDSADKVIQNYFFPNDSLTPTPSIPDGIWKNFTPFSNNIAVGKTYAEVYTTFASELSFNSTILSTVTSINSESLLNRTTGQECIAGVPVGFCTPTATPDTEAQCSIEGGTWTPASPDVIQNYAVVQDLMTTLKTNIQNLEDRITLERANIVSANALDADATRLAANTNAIANIDATLSFINTWQALPDFYTAHGATTCSSFNALNPALFPATKLDAINLALVGTETQDRVDYTTIRLAEMASDDYLGTITQDISGDGSITAATGLYGNRFRVIDMRLNLMAGSLNKLKGLEKGQGAQDELKNSNNSADALLTTVMSATAFRAPASGTKTIHVLDGSLFSAGNAGYVVANSQEEIAINITAVNTNTITLDVNIPKKYRQNEGARIYKVL